MQIYSLNNALSLNNKIKYDLQHCELKTLNWLLEDSAEELIRHSYDQCQEQPHVPLISIELGRNTYYVTTKGRVQVTIMCTPINTTDKAFHYSSSDPSIFTVTSKGVIVGISAGIATLTVKSTIDEEIVATATVNVSEEVERIPISLGELTNVDDSVNDAPDGTVLVMRDGTYIPDNFTDSVILDMSKPASELWQLITSTYPSTYAVTFPELLSTYPAEIIKADSQIRIMYNIELFQHVTDLTKINNIVYKNEYFTEYML